MPRSHLGQKAGIGLRGHRLPVIVAGSVHAQCSRCRLHRNANESVRECPLHVFVNSVRDPVAALETAGQASVSVQDAPDHTADRQPARAACDLNVVDEWYVDRGS